MTHRVLVALVLAALPLFGAAEPASGSDPLAPQAATPPRLLTLAASLNEDPGVSAGAVAGVTFAVYAEPEGGAPLWIETQNVSVGKGGLFTVLLGSFTPLPVDLFVSGEARWLAIQRVDGPERPRILLASVPYAFKAADADTLGGKPLSAFVLHETAAEPDAPSKVRAADEHMRRAAANTGPGNAALGYQLSPDRVVQPLVGSTAAISGTNSGLGSAGQFVIDNASSSARAVDVSNAGTGSGVFSTAIGMGVWGITSSISSAGILGDNSTGEAVVGRSAGNAGVGAVVGRTDGNGYGVRGFVGGSSATTAIGVLGQVGSGGSSGNAGKFQNLNSGNASPALVVTTSSGGLSAQFTGGVSITGSLAVSGTVSKGGGSFKIDHPLDPETKYLSHSFVESPDMKNVYDGVATADAAGRAIVELPSWFEALNRDFRYQLTAIGEPAPGLYIARKIANNRFEIAGAVAGMEISWMVTGIRRDRFAEKYRIPVEEMKEVENRGKYLHPEAFDKPSIQQIGGDQERGVATEARPPLASDTPALSGPQPQ